MSTAIVPAWASIVYDFRHPNIVCARHLGGTGHIHREVQPLRPLFVNPGVHRPFVAQDLLLAEKQWDFIGRGLGAIGAVDQVAPDLQAKIGADGARVGCGGVGGPHRLAHDVYGPLAPARW